MAAKREGPAAYFDLAPGDASGADGEDGPGCLALRRPPAWPSGRAGYTFAAWLRVETWRSEHLSERLGAEPNLKGSDDAAARARLAPRVALFAMRGASGMGVAAELGPSGVWLRVLEHAKAERVLLDARIETKRWMFVAVAHAPARPPLSSATARLYVDGELVSSKKLRFPRVAEPLTSCVIGAFDAFDAAPPRVPERGDASFVSASSFGSQNSSAEPFRGQIGVVRFFDDALSAAAVAAAAALGPDYVGAFSPTETASGIALANFGMSHSEAREIREALAPRLVLSLNAAAATGRSCFSTVADPAGGGVLAALAAARARVESRIKDGVAERDGGARPAIPRVPGDGTSASGTSPVAAELAGAARVCATHSAKDVVHCLGGVHVLFPLLAPGALGSGDGPRARSSELLVSKKMNATLDSNGPGLVVDAVDLLASLLEGSRLNQEALHTSGGFALVGRLLKMDGGARLSPALLPSAERLVRSVGRYAWAGPGNDPDQAAVRLLLDPHLWGAPRVSTETLAAHSAFLRRLAKRDPEALRALLPPPALVDAAAETGGNGSGSGPSRTVAVGPAGHRDDDVVETNTSDETNTNTNRRVTTPRADGSDGSRPRRRALLAVAGAVLLGRGASPLFSETAAAPAFAVEDAGASADAEAGARSRRTCWTRWWSGCSRTTRRAGSSRSPSPPSAEGRLWCSRPWPGRTPRPGRWPYGCSQRSCRARARRRRRAPAPRARPGAGAAPGGGRTRRPHARRARRESR